MYSKPVLTSYGTLRELTRLGAGVDCDGGAFGIVGGGTPSDGSSTFCSARTS